MGKKDLLTTQDLRELTGFKTKQHPIPKFPNWKTDNTGQLSLQNIDGDKLELLTWLEAAGANIEFYEHIFQRTRIRRLKRLEQQKVPEEINEPRYQSNRQKYLKKLTQEIWINRLKVWFSVVLSMGIRRYKNQYSYWVTGDEQDPRGSEFVWARMSEWEFYFINSCIRY